MVAPLAEAYYAYGQHRPPSPIAESLAGHPVLSAAAHGAILIVALILGAMVIAALVRPPHER